MLTKIMNSLFSLGGLMLMSGLFGMSQYIGFSLVVLSIPVFIVAGFIGVIIFIQQVREQIKTGNSGQKTETPRMSKIELIVGSIVVIVILTVPFAGVFWNAILCSFVDCGPK